MTQRFDMFEIFPFNYGLSVSNFCYFTFSTKANGLKKKHSFNSKHLISIRYAATSFCSFVIHKRELLSNIYWTQNSVKILVSYLFIPIISLMIKKKLEHKFTLDLVKVNEKSFVSKNTTVLPWCNSALFILKCINDLQYYVFVHVVVWDACKSHWMFIINFADINMKSRNIFLLKHLVFILLAHNTCIVVLNIVNGRE